MRVTNGERIGSLFGRNAAADSGAVEEEFVTVVWDLKNCSIPEQCGTSQICGNIRRVIGPNVEFHIIGDPCVRAEIQAAEPDANIVIASSGVADYDNKTIISRIHRMRADHKVRNHFLLITSDVDFCTIVSILRQWNIKVGVSCLPGSESSPILQWCANYVLNWMHLACGISQHLIEPRTQLCMPNDSCNKKPIYIYWDQDTCRIPNEIRSSDELMSKLTERFQNFLRSNGYWGSFIVFSYGNIGSISLMNQEILQANYISFEPVFHGEDGWNIDAADMIQNDASDEMLHCRCKSVFMIISDGDVRSISRSLKLQDHDVVVVRSTLSDSELFADQTLMWPDCFIRE